MLVQSGGRGFDETICKYFFKDFEERYFHLLRYKVVKKSFSYVKISNGVNLDTGLILPDIS